MWHNPFPPQRRTGFLIAPGGGPGDWGHPGQGPPLPSAPLHASHLSSSSQALSEEVIPDAAVRPLRPWRSDLRVLLCCLFNHLVPELQQLPLLLQKVKPPPGTQGLGPTFPAQLLLVPA